MNCNAVIKRGLDWPRGFFLVPPLFFPSLGSAKTSFFLGNHTLPHPLSLRLSFSLTPAPNHLVSCVSQSEQPTHLPTDSFPGSSVSRLWIRGFWFGLLFQTQVHQPRGVEVILFYFIFPWSVRPSTGLSVCLSLPTQPDPDLPSINTSPDV